MNPIKFIYYVCILNISCLVGFTYMELAYLVLIKHFSSTLNVLLLILAWLLNIKFNPVLREWIKKWFGK
ncbi:hypothetical protein [Niallia circulans]|uniref:hypothetical protein n=1 Tax=Niallia circulans TaxID=1397 RepID=UPI0013DDA266|nr:hypothetical protein [Niallia circulans]